jgi:hypothetical protein
LQVHYGAGAYICGEETALIESLEGKQVKMGERVEEEEAGSAAAATVALLLLACRDTEFAALHGDATFCNRAAATAYTHASCC